ELSGADGDDALGALRPPEREREVSGLHGPLRLRADSGERDLHQLARIPRHGGGHRDRALVTTGQTPVGAGLVPDESLEGWAPEPSAELPLARIIDLAFDYRGNTTVIKRDGAEVSGYLFNRDADAPAPFIQLFDSAGAGPFTIPYAEIRT